MKKNSFRIQLMEPVSIACLSNHHVMKDNLGWRWIKGDSSMRKLSDTIRKTDAKQGVTGPYTRRMG